MVTSKIRYLAIGSRFYVEPRLGEQIPVEIVEAGTWTLVYNVLELPCQRLDTGEYVSVPINIDTEVTLVQEESPNG